MENILTAFRVITVREIEMFIAMSRGCKKFASEVGIKCQLGKDDVEWVVCCSWYKASA